MADTTQLEAASRPTSSASRIALKILSPGSGVPETIDINDVPTDITIGILKSRITLISPSTPPADHQRLIYQGRVLANPSTKLADVFGADALRQHKSFTLHLVVRPNNSSTPNPPLLPSAPASTPANGVPTRPPSNASPTAVPGQQNGTPVQRPPHIPPIPGFPMPPLNGFPPAPFPQLPGMPQGAFAHIPGMPQGAFPAIPGMPPAAFPQIPGMAPGQFPQMMGWPHGQYQMQGLRFGGVPMPQQAPGQAPSTQQGQQQGGVPGVEGLEAQRRQGSPATDPVYQHMLAHQQALRAAAGQQGIGTGPNLSQNMHQGRPQPSTADDPSAGTQSAATLPQQPVSTQVTAPNGVQYQMTINQATFAIPSAQAAHAAQMAALRQQVGQNLAALQQLAQQPQHVQPAQQNGSAQGLGLAQSEVNNPARGHQNERRGDDAAQTEPSQQRVNENANVPHQAATQAIQSTTQPFSASTPTVYLLSSPSGPHAILFSPQGVYSTAPQSAPILPTPNVAQASGQPGYNAPGPAAQAVPVAVQQVVPGAHGQQHQAVQAQPVNAADVNVLAPIQPLLAHFWLLLRILLFAYFLLGSGQGWRRPLVLVAIVLVFFIIRGVDAGAGAREAVRGWWEGVVGVPPQQAQQGNVQQAAQGQVNAANQPGDAQAQQEGLAGQAQGAGAPQGNQPALSPLRARFRPIERAMALFVASLWPGIGERTVRARREEDARQLRQRQEAEVQAQQQALRNQESVTATTSPSTETPAQERLDGQTNNNVVSSGVDVGSGQSGQLRERHQDTGTGSSGDAENGRTGDVAEQTP